LKLNLLDKEKLLSSLYEKFKEQGDRFLRKDGFWQRDYRDKAWEWISRRADQDLSSVKIISPLGGLPPFLGCSAGELGWKTIFMITPREAVMMEIMTSIRVKPDQILEINKTSPAWLEEAFSRGDTLAKVSTEDQEEAFQKLFHCVDILIEETPPESWMKVSIEDMPTLEQRYSKRMEEITKKVILGSSFVEAYRENLEGLEYGIFHLRSEDGIREVGHDLLNCLRSYTLKADSLMLGIKRIGPEERWLGAVEIHLEKDSQLALEKDVSGVEFQSSDWITSNSKMKYRVGQKEGLGKSLLQGPELLVFESFLRKREETGWKVFEHTPVYVEFRSTVLFIFLGTYVLGCLYSIWSWL
jgi:hypothetical protein